MMIVQYVTNEEEKEPWTEDAMSTVVEADPDPPTYRYHDEDQLEPYSVHYHSMKAVKTVIKSFCLERNYPFLCSRIVRQEEVFSEVVPRNKVEGTTFKGVVLAVVGQTSSNVHNKIMLLFSVYNNKTWYYY
jgi:hypothetical protein